MDETSELSNAPESNFEFRVDYSTHKIFCAKCSEKIKVGELRFAKLPMVRQGLGRNWHHFDCIFTKYIPSSTAAIENFDVIRYEDQQKISERLIHLEYKEIFNVYYECGESKCDNCKDTINDKEVYIFIVSEEPKNKDLVRIRYHVDCFVEIRRSLNFYGSAENFKGYSFLDETDKRLLTHKITSMKKPQVRQIPEEIKTDIELKIKEQSDAFYANYERLHHFNMSELDELLEYNNECGANLLKFDKCIMVAEIMTYGLLSHCTRCAVNVVIKEGSYVCTNKKCGYESRTCERIPFLVPPKFRQNKSLKSYEYTKRIKITRKMMELEHFESLQGCNVSDLCESSLTILTQVENESSQSILTQVGENSQTILTQIAESSQTNFRHLEDESSVPLEKTIVSSADLNENHDKNLTSMETISTQYEVPAVENSILALQRMNVYYFGSNEKTAYELRDAVEKLGGNLFKEFNESVSFVVANKAELENDSAIILEAKRLKVPVVSENIIRTFKSLVAGDMNAFIWSVIFNNELSDNDVKRTLPSEANVVAKRGRHDNYQSVMSSNGIVPFGNTYKERQILKIDVVDPRFEFADFTHIYKCDDELYSAVLNRTVVPHHVSYYTMQLLETEECNFYWIFRSWGRAGTNLGDSAAKDFPTKELAVQYFEYIYFMKTGITWRQRKLVKQIPGKFCDIHCVFDE
ncbi:poly [ADP-ribose] polymerase 1-like protein [Leptotrombidium deliense]|uniref:NAD(+) ADP-ribosyltransferase n=1 Tax=Leptotrombidium deliense TaxID=299467 RepID=A0A443S9S9_9ACAR|nr:poly [ADP-ribose] polymerase 1-like protein [Leptotrombidium deliense]